MTNSLKQFVLLLGFIHCFTISFSNNIIAQNLNDLFGRLSGTIVDLETSEPLPFAVVHLQSSTNTYSTTSDSSGYFLITNVAVGRYDITAQQFGYQTYTARQVEILSGKEVQIHPTLNRKPSDLHEVTINATKKNETINADISVSGRMFSVEEANLFAGGFGDITRMAQSFAGVASSDGQTNEIIVRGNNPRGVLWRLEGIEIPNPNHFPRGDGSAGGGISIIQGNVIQNSDFITSAFPAEYGNASSSVLDIRMRKGSTSKHTFSFELGAIGIEASAEGPMSKASNNNKHSSYLMKYRYSTVALLEKIGINLVDNSITPQYQDLTFHIDCGIRKSGKWKVFGFAGYSTAGDKASNDTAMWSSPGDNRNQFERALVSVLGTRNEISIKSKRLSIHTVFSVQYSGTLNQSDSLQYNLQKVKLFNSNLTYLTTRLSQTYIHSVSSNGTLKAGWVLHIPYYRLQQQEPKTNVLQTTVDENGATVFSQGFFQYKHRWSNASEMIFGLHGIYNFLNNAWSIEPRIGLSISVKNNLKWSAGLGLHSRLDPISLYLHKTDGNQQINKNLPLQKALHVVFGFEFSFWNNARLKAELYSQFLYDVPVSPDTRFSMINYNNERINVALNKKGYGINYGMEITLEKFYSKGYYFLITASFFDALYSLDKVEFLKSKYASNYVVNASGGKDFTFGRKKNFILGANTRILAMGGYRFKPIDLEASKINGYETYQSNDYVGKFPAYFRWDCGLYFQVNRKKYNWKLSADFQNITNQKNVFSSTYNNISEKIENNYGLGFIPIVKWKIEF